MDMLDMFLRVDEHTCICFDCKIALHCERWDYIYVQPLD
jgi:hypothetical protein